MRVPTLAFVALLIYLINKYFHHANAAHGERNTGNRGHLLAQAVAEVVHRLILHCEWGTDWTRLLWTVEIQAGDGASEATTSP